MYIAIAGNIGSGKSTLTEMLSARYNAKAYYEPTDNPYLSDFYSDMKSWSFHLQTYFLCSRIELTQQMLSEMNDNGGYIFQDRTIYEDAHIFATNLYGIGEMSERDFGTYKKIFDLFSSATPKPDLLIYLKADVDTLMRQIAMRGRECEADISAEYLESLNVRYNNWIETIYDGRVLVVDKNRDDFVRDSAVFESICAQIESLK